MGADGKKDRNISVAVEQAAGEKARRFLGLPPMTSSNTLEDRMILYPLLVGEMDFPHNRITIHFSSKEKRDDALVEIDRLLAGELAHVECDPVFTDPEDIVALLRESLLD